MHCSMLAFVSSFGFFSSCLGSNDMVDEESRATAAEVPERCEKALGMTLMSEEGMTRSVEGSILQSCIVYVLGKTEIWPILFDKSLE